MFFPIFKNKKCALLGLLMLPALSACGGDEAEIAAAQEAALVGNKIECALNGSDSFALNCATERVETKDGTILMIRHSDGGFRRFRILTDGRGLEVAEGFDDSRIEIVDENYIILSSGKEKYKLKAQFTSNAGGENSLPPLEGDENNAELITEEVEGADTAALNQALPDSAVGPKGKPGAPYPIPR